MHNLNEKIFSFINGAAGQSLYLDGFLVFISKIFVPATIVLVLFWFFIFLPKKLKTIQEKSSIYKSGGIFILSLGIVWPLVELIKGLIAFPRPLELLTNVHSLIVHTGYDSFPSLHSALAFTVAVFVYHYSKPTGMILFLLAVLVGVSRIFVGVHFPLDVVIGACIGALVPCLLISLFKRSTV